MLVSIRLGTPTLIPVSLPLYNMLVMNTTDLGHDEKNHAEKDEMSMRRYAMTDKTMPPSSHKTIQEVFEALEVELHVSLHSSQSIIGPARERHCPGETVLPRTWSHPFVSSAAVSQTCGPQR